MIIARSPLRITLGGGGTDLPSYYEKFGGFLIAAAIDKYVYITLHDTFVPDLIVKYSELERVPDAARLKHPIIREAFAVVGMDGHGLELTSMADIPAGTGLGSSSSFTTALLKALHAHKKISFIPPNSPRRPVKSNWGASRSPSASRTNTSRLTAASPVSNFSRAARSRRGL
jgi:galactokinase/mevalonate kinase-like predicted kinase